MTIESFFVQCGQWWRALAQVPWEYYVLLAGIGLAFFFARLILGRLAKHGRLPRGLARSLTWIYLLILVYSLEYAAPAQAGASQLRPLLLVLKTLFWWFLAKNLLDGLYTGVYREKIIKRPVNQYFMDLLKFGLLMVLVLGAATSLFDLKMSSVLASSAILTAIIGFSIQDTISSFVSGLLIQLEKPFTPGDWISMGQLKGCVVELSWRYTKIRTIEKNYILIPNNVISKDNVVNYYSPIREVRTEVPLPVPLDVPPVRAKAAIKEALKNCPLVAPAPPPAVRADEVREDRMIYTAVFFVRRYEDLRPARDEYISSAWYYFRKHGVALPYPIRELRRPDKGQVRAEAEVRESVKSVPFLATLSDQQLDTLIQVAADNTYDPGAVIVRQGGTGTSMYVILDGEVVVKHRGNEIARLEAGSFFGEMALLTGQPRNADVVSLTPVRCLEIDREAFRLVLENNQELIGVIRETFEKRDAEDRARNRSPEADSLFERFRRIFSLA